MMVLGMTISQNSPPVSIGSAESEFSAILRNTNSTVTTRQLKMTLGMTELEKMSEIRTAKCKFDSYNTEVKNGARDDRG